MSRLVVHAGLSKTGTTSFQAFGWHNRDRLAARGVVYSDGFRRRNHAELAIAFTRRISPLTRSYGVHSEADRMELRERLPSMLAPRRGTGTLLVSTEHLTLLVRQPDDVAALAEFLRGLFSDIVVLIALRRPDYWAPSAYVESVKAGASRPFDADFVRRHEPLANHVRLLETWRAAFGDTAVVPVPFLETDKSDAIALPARLLAAAGIAVDDLAEWPEGPEVNNPSLSSYGVEVLRRLNEERADSPMKSLHRRYDVVPIVRHRWPGPGPALTPDAAEELQQRGWARPDLAAFDPAHTDLWQRWAAHPSTPTAPTPEVADEDLTQLVGLLRHEGLIDRRWTNRVLARSRRLSRRILARQQVRRV